MRTCKVLLWMGAAAMAAACGGDDAPATECGPGTTLMDGTCVVTDPTTCGAGTTLVNGECVPEPPPPPVTCGPGTTLQGQTCVIDQTAPAPVTGLTATVNGAAIDLAWTPGAGATETLVARLPAGGESRPLPLTSYAVGDTLPGGGVVIARGAVSTVSDAATTPGRYAYAAFPINASGVYGFGREVAAVRALPAQTATLTLDIGAATATVTTQPSHVALAVTDVAVAGDAVTFTLTATNQTAGHLLNPKAVVTAVSAGQAADATGTLRTGEPFYRFHLGAHLPGMAKATPVRLTGVPASGTVTLQLSVKEGAPGLHSANLFDVDGGPGEVLEIPVLAGNRRSRTVVSGATMSPSGRYAFVVLRNAGLVGRIDLADLGTAAVATSPFPSHGICIGYADDGGLYAVYGRNSHRRVESSGVALVRFEPLSFHVAVVGGAATAEPARVATCAMRGNRVAIAQGTEVHLLDMPTGQLVASVDTGSDVRIRELAFSPDGATLYATPRRSDYRIWAIDTTTRAVTMHHTASAAVNGLTVDAAGVLWWGTGDGLYSFDGTTQTKIPAYGGPVQTIARVGATSVLVVEPSQVVEVARADGARSGAASLPSSTVPGHEVAIFTGP